MERSLNSRCDFENSFFTCDLPEDAILLILKVKTQTGNHTLVEDMEKQTEKFRPWKKQVKDGKQVESVTPPSLRNLSLEEETNEPEHEATSWEANVARNLETLPRSSSPYPRKTSTLEDLELDMDDNMVDITDFFERPPNEKRSPRPKQTDSTQGYCPTPQNSPT